MLLLLSSSDFPPGNIIRIFLILVNAAGWSVWIACPVQSKINDICSCSNFHCYIHARVNTKPQGIKCTNAHRTNSLTRQCSSFPPPSLSWTAPMLREIVLIFREILQRSHLLLLADNIDKDLNILETAFALKMIYIHFLR